LNRRFHHRVLAAENGRRLDEWAREWLSRALGRAVARSEVRRWVMAGAVRLEGAPPRHPAAALVAGRRIEVRIRAEAAGPRARTTPPRIDASNILFEDAWLVAVDKPAGLPTHATADPRRPHLVGLLTGLLAKRANPGGADAGPRLGVHQRLDRDTSGVILFSKNPSANPGLARQFAERTVRKTYHALTARPEVLPPPRWTATGRLPREGRGPGAEAVTELVLVECFASGLLVEARPRTGRKHQIRLHLAAAGLPVLGDDRHGPPRARAPRDRAGGGGRLMLHAGRLELLHPVTGEPLVIESPWPPDFCRMVEALRSPRAGLRAGPRRSSSPR
jgi:RluA family pseudouridine synthase